MWPTVDLGQESVKKRSRNGGIMVKLISELMILGQNSQIFHREFYCAGQFGGDGEERL